MDQELVKAVPVMLIASVAVYVLVIGAAIFVRLKGHYDRPSGSEN